MYKEVKKYLSYYNIPVSESWLRLRLESHPDYPSLIAIQDTLEELGVNCQACRGNKEELKQENKPFLLHLHTGGGAIRFFQSVTAVEKKVPDFEQQWSGAVLFIEKTDAALNEENRKLVATEQLNRIFGCAVILISLISLFTLSIIQQDWIQTAFIISNSIGLYFSWLIILKEFGIANKISDKICSMASNSRCESVLFSKGARLFKWLSWGDVGVIYFSSSLIFSGLCLLAGFSPVAWYLLSLAGLIFPFYSVWYQSQKVKQWCMLCLAVLGILVVNAIVSSFFTSWTNTNPFLVSSATLLTVFIIVLAAWQLLKPLYRKGLSALKNEISNTRLKRNPHLFYALLEKQSFETANLPQPEEAIRFGNEDAPYQLVIACNPYCGPCVKAHHAVEKLFETYPDKLNIAIRFALHTTDATNQTTQRVIEILKAAQTRPYEAIRDWYRLLDMEKFKGLYNSSSMDVNSHIEAHKTWTEQAKITGTPTFFINGRQLNDLYSWAEMLEVAEYELK